MVNPVFAPGPATVRSASTTRLCPGPTSNLSRPNRVPYRRGPSQFGLLFMRYHGFCRPVAEAPGLPYLKLPNGCAWRWKMCLPAFGCETSSCVVLPQLLRIQRFLLQVWFQLKGNIDASIRAKPSTRCVQSLLSAFYDLVLIESGTWPPDILTSSRALSQVPMLALSARRLQARQDISHTAKKPSQDLGAQDQRQWCRQSSGETFSSTYSFSSCKDWHARNMRYSQVCWFSILLVQHISHWAGKARWV